MARLTAKQKRFGDEYLVDMNATQAAMRAGYSPKTANEQGARLLANVSVQAYIQERMKAREQRTEITQDRVLRELARIGFADIKNYMSYRTVMTKVGEDDDGDILDYAPIIELLDSNQVDGAAISEISLKDGSFKFKLHDKVSALEKIGRHLGMFNDKLEVKGKMVVFKGEDELED